MSLSMIRGWFSSQPVPKEDSPEISDLRGDAEQSDGVTELDSPGLQLTQEVIASSARQAEQEMSGRVGSWHAGEVEDESEEMEQEVEQIQGVEPIFEAERRQLSLRNQSPGSQIASEVESEDPGTAQLSREHNTPMQAKTTTNEVVGTTQQQIQNADFELEFPKTRRTRRRVDIYDAPISEEEEDFIRPQRKMRTVSKQSARKSKKVRQSNALLMQKNPTTRESEQLAGMGAEIGDEAAVTANLNVLKTKPVKETVGVRESSVANTSVLRLDSGEQAANREQSVQVDSSTIKGEQNSVEHSKLLPVAGLSNEMPLHVGRAAQDTPIPQINHSDRTSVRRRSRRAKDNTELRPIRREDDDDEDSAMLLNQYLHATTRKNQVTPSQLVTDREGNSTEQAAREVPRNSLPLKQKRGIEKDLQWLHMHGNEVTTSRRHTNEFVKEESVPKESINDVAPPTKLSKKALGKRKAVDDIEPSAQGKRRARKDANNGDQDIRKAFASQGDATFTGYVTASNRFQNSNKRRDTINNEASPEPMRDMTPPLIAKTFHKNTSVTSDPPRGSDNASLVALDDGEGPLPVDTAVPSPSVVMYDNTDLPHSQPEDTPSKPSVVILPSQREQTRGDTYHALLNHHEPEVKAHEGAIDSAGFSACRKVVKKPSEGRRKESMVGQTSKKPKINGSEAMEANVASKAGRKPSKSNNSITPPMKPTSKREPGTGKPETRSINNQPGTSMGNASGPLTPKPIASAKSKTETASSRRRAADPDLKAMAEAIECYQEENGMTQTEVNALLHKNAHTEGQELWRRIFAIVPHLPRQKALKKCRRQFHNFLARGIWTADQDEELKLAYEQYPAKWAKIGEVLNRFHEDCRDRWRNYLVCADKQKEGLWSVDEENELREKVHHALSAIRDLRRRNKIRDVNKSDVELIDWNTISNQMIGTRSRLQCAQKFKSLKEREDSDFDAPVESLSGTKWRLKEAYKDIEAMTVADELAFLYMIRDSNAGTEGKIPWSNLTYEDKRNRKGMRLAWKLLLRHLREQVRGYQDMKLQDVIRHLIGEFELSAPHRPASVAFFEPTAGEARSASEVLKKTKRKARPSRADYSATPSKKPKRVDTADQLSSERLSKARHVERSIIATQKKAAGRRSAGSTVVNGALSAVYAVDSDDDQEMPRRAAEQEPHASEENGLIARRITGSTSSSAGMAEEVVARARESSGNYEEDLESPPVVGGSEYRGDADGSAIGNMDGSRIDQADDFSYDESNDESQMDNSLESRSSGKLPQGSEFPAYTVDQHHLPINDDEDNDEDDDDGEDERVSVISNLEEQDLQDVDLPSPRQELTSYTDNHNGANIQSPELDGDANYQHSPSDGGNEEDVASVILEDFDEVQEHRRTIMALDLKAKRRVEEPLLPIKVEQGQADVQSPLFDLEVPESDYEQAYKAEPVIDSRCREDHKPTVQDAGTGDNLVVGNDSNLPSSHGASDRNRSLALDDDLATPDNQHLHDNSTDNSDDGSDSYGAYNQHDAFGHATGVDSQHSVDEEDGEAGKGESHGISGENEMSEENGNDHQRVFTEHGAENAAGEHSSEDEQHDAVHPHRNEEHPFGSPDVNGDDVKLSTPLHNRADKQPFSFPAPRELPGSGDGPVTTRHLAASVAQGLSEDSPFAKQSNRSRNGAKESSMEPKYSTDSRTAVGQDSQEFLPFREASSSNTSLSRKPKTYNQIVSRRTPLKPLTTFIGHNKPFAHLHTNHAMISPKVRDTAYEDVSSSDDSDMEEEIPSQVLKKPTQRVESSKEPQAMVSYPQDNLMPEASSTSRKRKKRAKRQHGKSPKNRVEKVANDGLKKRRRAVARSSVKKNIKHAVQ